MSIWDVTLTSVAEIIGDFGFKDFARTNSLTGFAQGSLGYIGVIFCLIRSLKVGNVLYVNGLWDGVSAILETFAAYFILGERLNNPIEYAGLAVIILGIFMLHTSKPPY
jgi:multidrug transporter EmrE-like cation transporter